MNWLRRERSLWIAWPIVVVVYFLTGDADVVMDLISSAIFAGYIVLVVRYFRGPVGIWGYVWRGLLVGYVVVPLVIIPAAFLTDLTEFLGMAWWVLVPVFCWLLFGSNRLATLKACLRI